MIVRDQYPEGAFPALTLGAIVVPAAVEVAAYRIISEALTNVVRHARASVCDVRIWLDGDVYVELRDNGRGLPPDYRPGMGLTSIRERCAELGGTASITPNLPTGTRVACRLPVPSAGLDAAGDGKTVNLRAIRS